MNGESILSVQNLHVNYGGIRALRGVSLDVNEGEIITLVGANGAGKSTLMNSIMGLVSKASGSIHYKGEDITTTETAKIVKKGIVLSPEGRHIFQMGGTLSGGEQQMLAIGRALMARPKIMMLDEPSLGLAPLIISNIFDLFASIRDMGVTIILVEQNARIALKVADRGYVIESGSVVLEDTASNLLKSESVIKAYLS